MNLFFKAWNSSTLLNIIKFIKLGIIKTIIQSIIKPNIPFIFITFTIVKQITEFIVKQIAYFRYFLKYLNIGVLNSYLWIKYGSIQAYETNKEIDVAIKIPTTPKNLHNKIDNTILVIAPIYGVLLDFSNKPNEVL